MVTKNMAYDHPAYIAVSMYNFGQNAAGASTNFTKFIAFSQLTLKSITANLITAGTSTYTAWQGTATTTQINGDSFSLLTVKNTSTTTVPALSTTTYGPYSVGPYNGTATGTQTGAGGYVCNILLAGTGGVAGQTSTAGITLNQGDYAYIVRGTDATAITGFAMEYSLAQLANVTLST